MIRRAAKPNQVGHMRPAGLVFETLDLVYCKIRTCNFPSTMDVDGTINCHSNLFCRKRRWRVSLLCQSIRPSLRNARTWPTWPIWTRPPSSGTWRPAINANLSMWDVYLIRTTSRLKSTLCKIINWSHSNAIWLSFLEDYFSVDRIAYIPTFSTAEIMLSNTFFSLRRVFFFLNHFLCTHIFVWQWS